MSESFIGEIRLMPYTFAPMSWLDCNGQLLAIGQYQALYSILGTTFGGDGQSNFGVPDLRGRVVIDTGNDPTDPFHPAYGASGGAEKVTLAAPNIPQHTHGLNGATQPNPVRTNIPTNNYISQVVYRPTTGAPVGGLGFFDNASSTPALVPMNAGSVSTYAGQSQPHENRQPYLPMRYCICFEGVYPTPP